MEEHALFQEILAGCIESTRLGYQRLFLENQLFHYGIQHPCLWNEVFHCKSFWSSTKLGSFVNKDLRSRCWGWTGETGSLISFRLLALWLSPFHSEVCCTNLCFYWLLFLNHFYLWCHDTQSHTCFVKHSKGCWDGWAGALLVMQAWGVGSCVKVEGENPLSKMSSDFHLHGTCTHSHERERGREGENFLKWIDKLSYQNKCYWLLWPYLCLVAMPFLYDCMDKLSSK